MPKLRSWIGGLLVLTATQLYARDEPYAVPFEVGQRVEITLAKPYLSAEGVRVHDTSMRLADKETLTLAAGGQERSLSPSRERGRVQGLVTGVDDAWLTLDLGEKQPFLRIPRAAIIRWETLGLAAQGSEPLPTGQRIRVVSRELRGQLVAGRLLAIDDETLLVKVDDRAQPIRLRRTSIAQIEVSRGKHGRAWKGALIGATAVGIPLAILVGINGGPLLESPRPVSLRPFWDGLCGGAVLGAPIGALIGSAFKSEHWERVPVSVAIAPQRRGARAALTLRF